MQREWLAERLEAGASIEAIAREVGRDPSTVSYWVRKHGLRSAHAERHAARGPIDRQLLAEIVALRPVRPRHGRCAGTQPDDCAALACRYGLSSGPTRRRAAVAAADREGLRELELSCDRHGPTRHVRRADGFRCARCEVRRVVAWRRKVKRILVEEAGGACVLCGYADCPAALQFHHVDPSQSRSR
jgi:transposase-like protein